MRRNRAGIPGPQGGEDAKEESDTLELPARDRRGKLALLGPISLGVSLLSWLTPLVGMAVAVIAIVLGVVSIRTRREYRIDWTAVAGISVGGAQLFFEVVLLAMGASGL